VAAGLPEHELLDVLAYGYGVVAQVVAEAHKQCNVVMQTFGDEAHEGRPRRRSQLGGRLSCMVAHAKLRTAYVHLAQDVVVEWGTRTRELPRKDVESMELPDGMLGATGEHVPGRHLLDTADGLVSAAKALTAHAGGHEPIAMVYETRDDAPVICSLNARDHATQTLMMEAVADEGSAPASRGCRVHRRDSYARWRGRSTAGCRSDSRRWRMPVAHADKAAGRWQVGNGRDCPRG